MVIVKDSIINAGHYDTTLSGFYQGMLLCKNCEGIQRTILFSGDDHFKMEELELGKNMPAKRIEGTWEKEKGNYEANWGGKSGEDNGVQFSPSGEFLEYAMAIPPSELPASVTSYIKGHYKGQSIKEAAKVTDAKGALTYEAEIKGKELIFDAKGNFLKENMGD